MARKQQPRRRVRLLKRGRVWWLRYHQHGVDHRVSTGTTVKEMAELARDALEVKLFEDPWFNPKQRCEVTLDQFAPRFLEWSKQNKRAYKRDCGLLRNLQAHFGRMVLDRIASTDVEAYKNRRLNSDLLFGDPPRQPSKATVNRELSRLRRVLNLAVKWGELSENPLAGKLELYPESGDRVRYLSAEQADLLLSKCVDYLKPVVRLAMLTGMRKSELVGLPWSEVDLARGVIRLPGKRTKNRKPRTVPLSGQARVILRERARLRPDDCPLVFWREPLPRRGRRVERKWEALGSVRKGYEGARKRAHESYVEARKKAGRRVEKSGFEDLRFHDLRHHFASALAQRGVSLQAVGELLGHQTPEMTLRYAHLSPQVLQSAVEQAARYLDGEGEAEPAPLAVVRSAG